MTIVFVSHLSGTIAAGLSWSIPARIAAQEEIDKVLWVDSSRKILPHWKSVKAYHRLTEFRELKLNNLPESFQYPDYVIFEGFYCIREVLFAKELRKRHIPYIIVPRGSLTYQAMHNHSYLKKKIAHMLWFDSFVKDALAIQYLTKAEQYESRHQPCKHSFILPNGYNQPLKIKTIFSDKGIKAVFIGRLDLYHKGLDMLLEAISKEQGFLRETNFILDIYGPKQQDFEKIKELINKFNINDIVALKGEISGDAKENVLLEADLFVLTSRFEGHPMGLIEALAYGLPVFVTPGSNMAEEIAAEEAGWVAEGSVKSIASQLRYIVSKKAELPQKSKKARVLSQRYCWNRLANNLHEILEELINMNKS